MCFSVCYIGNNAVNNNANRNQISCTPTLGNTTTEFDIDEMKLLLDESPCIIWWNENIKQSKNVYDMGIYCIHIDLDY